MDSDNPWGDPSPTPTPAKEDPPSLPKEEVHVASESVEIKEEEEETTWANAARDTEKEATATLDVGTGVGLRLEHPVEKDEDRIGASEEEEESEVHKVEEEEKATSPPTKVAPVMTLSPTPPQAQDEGPPMDDFSDDEEPTLPPPTSTTDAFDDDDFDDFGEAGGAGGDEDDDFGDFGGDDDVNFGPSSPIPTPAPVPAPVASTSGLPPLRLDLSSQTTKESLAPQLADFFRELYPSAEEAVSDEPEREVEGIGQVLVSESSRGLLSTLSSLPPLRPLDWRRSKIRREHLIALGVPVNLDDSAESKPLASLVLPPVRTSSPHRSPSLATASRASAPAGSLSPLPFTSSPNPSRPSTPSEDRRRLASIPPPLDKRRAKELVGMQSDDLALMSLGRLKLLKEEFERISMEASEVLTHALLMREKEVADGETYHGMIQDLVSAAARMKTTSASLSRSGSGAGASRWGRKSTGSTTSAVR